MYTFHLLTITLLLVSSSQAQQCSPPTCSSSNPKDYLFFQTNSSLSDSIYLVGLFGIHEAGTSILQCGSIRERGLHNAEAFRYAINTFHARYPSSLQNVNIGGLIFDSCGRSQRLTQEVFNLEGCRIGYGDASSPVIPNLVIGYVGPDKSGETADLAPAIGQLEKTLISHAATSASLSNPTMYPTLLRTVPSDSEQIKVIMAILKSQDWKYIQVVYSANTYGTSGYETLKSSAADQGVCIVNTEVISTSASSNNYISIIDSLTQNLDTRAVVVIANDNFAQGLLQAAQQRNTKGRFTFIGTNSWSNSATVVDGAEESAWGAITIGLLGASTTVTNFEQYMSNLKPTAPDTNMWFAEYWMNRFECKLPGYNSGFTRDCNTDLQTLPAQVDPYVPYTIQAVDAFILGLEEARASQCSGTTNLCNSFLNDPDKWSVIHDKIRQLRINGNLQFNVSTGDSARSKHVIYNYRRNDGYQQVGTYENGGLNLNEAIFSYNTDGDIIQSANSECSQQPCTQCGQIATTTVIPSTENPTSTTVKQDDGSASDGNKNNGPMPLTGLRREGWIYALIILAGLGILLVIVFELYLMSKMLGKGYLRRWGSMWLGQLLLLGIFLSYLTLFAFVPHASTVSCSLIRFGVGVSYAMCFAVLLVKLMIILSSKSLGYLKGIYQVLMFLFAWIVQIAIDAQWIMLQPEPDVLPINNSTGAPIYQCTQGFLDHVQSLTYVMCLIFLCVVIAIKSHGIVTNYREGIFIGLSAGFTVPVWLAWILLGQLTEDPALHEPCLAFGLLITATLLLLIMFLPKVRQLNNMGREGIYAEDEYAGSIIAPSVLPPGSVIATKSVNGHSNIGYVKSPRNRKPPVMVLADSVSLVNGGTGVTNVDFSDGVYSEPKVIKSNYQSDTNALYMRHPGAPQTTLGSASVRSMPITRGGALYTLPRKQMRNTDTQSVTSHQPTLLRVPADSRRAASEIGYYTTRSTRSGRSMGSTTGTLKKPKSYLDLGSL